MELNRHDISSDEDEKNSSRLAEVKMVISPGYYALGFCLSSKLRAENGKKRRVLRGRMMMKHE